MTDSMLDILGKNLKKKGLSEKAHISQLFYKLSLWLEKELPAIQEYIHLEKIEGGELFITGTHSIALQEVQSRSVELLAFIARESELTVKRIRVSRK